jgi:hypothetical protein
MVRLLWSTWNKSITELKFWKSNLKVSSVHKVPELQVNFRLLLSWLHSTVSRLQTVLEKLINFFSANSFQMLFQTCKLIFDRLVRLSDDDPTYDSLCELTTYFCVLSAVSRLFRLRQYGGGVSRERRNFHGCLFPRISSLSIFKSLLLALSFLLVAWGRSALIMRHVETRAPAAKFSLVESKFPSNFLKCRRIHFQRTKKPRSPPSDLKRKMLLKR